MCLKRKEFPSVLFPWTPHDLWMFAFHLFSYGSCALLRVKMESIYIYSVFIRGRLSGLVECLSYWHTCCVSSGSTETQWHCMAACHAAPLCVYTPSAANSPTCWLYGVCDSLWFDEMKTESLGVGLAHSGFDTELNSLAQGVKQQHYILEHLKCLFFSSGWVSWVVTACLPSLLRRLLCQKCSLIVNITWLISFYSHMSPVQLPTKVQ